MLAPGFVIHAGFVASRPLPMAACRTGAASCWRPCHDYLATQVCKTLQDTTVAKLPVVQLGLPFVPKNFAIANLCLFGTQNPG